MAPVSCGCCDSTTSNRQNALNGSGSHPPHLLSGSGRVLAHRPIDGHCDGAPSSRHPRRRRGRLQLGLIEQDEAGTLLRLKDRRSTILEPLLAKHHGRIIKLMGDGVLAEFPSAVDAVHCAVDIQKQMDEANTKLSDERVIIFRIGINLGDVVVENGDLYGDGVNIAARLEGIASPGAVLVSAAVHEQVERKLPFSFTDLGNHTLKNLTKPVRVYGVVDGGVRSATGMGLVSGRAFPLPPDPLLPFCRLTISAATRSSGTSATVSPKTSSQSYHASGSYS